MLLPLVTAARCQAALCCARMSVSLANAARDATSISNSISSQRAHVHTGGRSAYQFREGLRSAGEAIDRNYVVRGASSALEQGVCRGRASTEFLTFSNTRAVIVRILSHVSHKLVIA